MRLVTDCTDKLTERTFVSRVETDWRLLYTGSLGRQVMADYFGIEELLTDEERMTRDLARDFTDKEVIPIITEHYRAGTFPRHLVKRLAALEFFGADLPDDTRPAVSPVAFGLLVQELERGDSAIRTIVGVQSMGMFILANFGSAAQRAWWYRQLATGGWESD